MRWITIVGVVLLASLAVISAKPARTPICKQIRKSGCTSKLKQTGKVCGTDGKTYRNACVLQKQACKQLNSLGISFYAKCEAKPQLQTGGNGGEQTQNERGEDTGNGDTGDNGDNQNGDRGDTGDTPDTPDAPDQEQPGAQGAPGVTDSPDTPDQPDSPNSISNSNSNSRSSEEAGAGGGGAGGTGGAGRTLAPQTTLPLLSPVAKVCPDICPVPKRQDVLCASNGQNYKSKCYLLQYICQTNETIVPLHRGLCNYTCGPECPLVYEPVCGTDGLTYMSRCDLIRTACLTMDDTLLLDYNQECSGIALLKGCQECNPAPEPVCSTNNMTFRSQCEFDRFICIFDVRGLELATNGSCPSAPLVCPNYCHTEVYRVCGSDGVTYPNVCELGVADCHARYVNPMGNGIVFSSNGPCLVGTVDPCTAECDLTEAPVCAMKGTEKVSYYNRCYFQKEVCFDPTITFVKEGKCAPTNPKPAKASWPGKEVN